MKTQLTELSLFSGSGGGLLASKYLLGWKTIGMVEYEKYCQQVLQQRQDDGLLDKCPVFGDVREFIEGGFAECYKGITDVVTAGFPCQPFSTAGKRLGKDDSRNMWPSTLRVIEIVRPKIAFLENVAGLLSSGYFQDILCGLSEIGYNAKWQMLSAKQCGAPHQRKRLWILAYPKSVKH